MRVVDGEEIREDGHWTSWKEAWNARAIAGKPNSGDAGAERGQQHGERKAGERPPNRRCAFRTTSDCLISFSND